MIWESYPTKPSVGTDGDWVGIINNLPGWTAESKWFTWETVKKDIIALTTSGSYLMIVGTLDTTTGIMVGEELQSEGGFVPHWLTVTSVSDYGIKIYNPFINGYQIYTWNEYRGVGSKDGKMYGYAIGITYSPPKAPIYKHMNIFIL